MKIFNISRYWLNVMLGTIAYDKFYFHIKRAKAAAERLIASHEGPCSARIVFLKRDNRIICRYWYCKNHHRGDSIEWDRADIPGMKG